MDAGAADEGWARIVAQTDGEQPPVPMGYEQVDELLGGGMQPGSVTLVAGVSGVGITTFAVGVAVRSAMIDRNPVSLIALDGDAADLRRRAIFAHSYANSRAAAEGLLTDADRLRAAESGAAIDGAELRIVGPALDVDAVLDEAGTDTGRRGVRLIVVDGADLLGDADFARLLRELKLLARRSGAAVVATMPLVRELWVDGALADDFAMVGRPARIADAVLLIHRPDRWERGLPRDGEVDLVVAKNPVGPTGVTVVASQLNRCRFIDMPRR